MYNIIICTVHNIDGLNAEFDGLSLKHFFSFHKMKKEATSSKENKYV